MHHCKMAKTTLVLWILALLEGVASIDIVPLVLGPEFQRAYGEQDILRGFKLNVQEGEDPLQGIVFTGKINPLPFSTSYAKSSIITSAEEVRKMTELSGHLSVAYGPMISGSGAGSYLENKVQSKRQISILYRTRKVAFARKVDVGTLKPITGLETLSRDERTEKYGSKFIDQILYGAQLDLIYTLESAEDTDLMELAAELKGRIGFGPLSVEFQALFELEEGSTSSRYSLSIEAMASGINFSVPSNPSFDATNQLIKDFNNAYDKMLEKVGQGESVAESHVASQFSPVAFALSPIDEYLGSKLDLAESARFDDKMKSLSTSYYHALFVKSQLSKIAEDQKELYGRDPKTRVEVFGPYKDMVIAVQEELDLKIDECLEFRKKSMREIVGTSAKVPSRYANEDVLAGLNGAAYIPSPVSIQGALFDELYYQGFAIPKYAVDDSSDSYLIPWMGGKLRRDDDRSVVASAYTPGDLVLLAMEEISSGAGHKYLKYGDQVFFQVSTLDYRWLKRDSSTNNTMSNDYLSESDNTNSGLLYQWNVRSVVGKAVTPDPKVGQCVKYGDVIFLNNHGMWMHKGLGLGSGGHPHPNVDTVKDGFETSRLQWKVRSTTKGDLDPAGGQCIQILSKIYLQCNEEKNLWVTGGRSAGNIQVVLDEKYYEGQNLSHMEWIVRKEAGDGMRDAGFFCPADSAKGRWKPLQLTPPLGRPLVYVGINRTFDFPPRVWVQTETWEDSVTASITGGFQFGGVYIPWIGAKDREDSVRKVLHNITEMDMNVETTGQAWQFVYDISDACTRMWELQTRDGVTTDNENQKPCCLPGQELDPSQPHGPCVLQSACQCEQSVCNPQAPDQVQNKSSVPTVAPSDQSSGAPKKNPWSLLGSIFAAVPATYLLLVVGVFLTGL
mmetsp:Transcript_1058/g.2223  ORF Transcript_1058/g.2223 Transcript_1058/m.2223 type:complete len:898 (-) Transcript_1058:62-2755(-)